MWGDENWQRRRDESEAREREHHAKLDAESETLAAILVRAGTDLETARLIEMAKLLSPDSWASRTNTLESIERRRRGKRANDPREIMQLEMMARQANLALRYGIMQAQRAISMVRGWERNDAAV